MARRRIKRTKSKKKTQVKVLDIDPIPCEFLKRTEWAGVLPDKDGPTKCGRYHQSVWHDVKGFGDKKWVVGSYVIVDYETLMEDGMTENEITQGCIKYLNTPPPRRKYQRKASEPLYGNLDPVPVRYNLIEKDEQKVILMMLATDQRKNKYFWGEGPKY